MKNFFKILLLFGLTSYLVFSFFRLGESKDDSICSELKVIMYDSLHSGLITATEIERMLLVSNLHPVGKKMDSIRGKDIEEALKENHFIKDVVFYKLPGGIANVIVQQHSPIMRIMPDNGTSYYIDERGERQNPLHYNANLIVATGNIDSTYIKEKLVNLALYLHNDDFWNNQIMQVNVNKDRHIDLVTRIGSNMQVKLGTADSIQRKFSKLKAFYEKVMPEVGWNTYKEIDLEYNNQIVCKKR